MEAIASTHTAWDALCVRLRISKPQCEHWWGTIRDAYEGPGRYYHTLQHLSDLLSQAKAHANSIQNLDAVELAIFFHDIVYDAKNGGGGKMERDSAEVFRAFEAQSRPSFAAGDKVYDWIVATASHRCSEDDERDKKLFMDMDMSILAAPRAEYARYAANVRREYAHFNELFWCWGRAKFLSASAASDTPIFATEEYRATGEAAARRNAASEASELRMRLALMLLLALTLLILLVFLLATRGSSASIGGITAALAVSAGWQLTRYERFPYDRHGPREDTVALFAGSFNPPHLGHLAIITHLARRHKTLYVVIGHNPGKRYPVSPSERKRLVEAMVRAAGLGGSVVVETTSDYVWRLARAVGARVLYRGIRTWRTDGLAERWLELLNLIGPPLLAPLGRPLRTSFLQADPALVNLSSSEVRRRCSGLVRATDGDSSRQRLAAAVDRDAHDSQPLSGLVPDSIAEEVRRLYSTP